MPPLEPDLSIRSIAAETIALYRRHWKLLAPLAVAVLIPQTILGSILGEIEVERVQSVGDVLNLLTIPLFTLVALGGEALLAGVVTALVLQWRSGHPPLGPREFVRTLPWVSLIAVDFLIAVGAAAGLLLLIVPGLIFLSYFGIAPAVIELERRRVWDALKRSASLVQGNFQRVFVLVVVSILATEAIAEGFHLAIDDFLPALVAEITVNAVLESAQALVIALVAISLIHLRGHEIPRRTLVDFS